MLRRLFSKRSCCGHEAQEAELHALRREVSALRARLAEIEGGGPCAGPVLAVDSFAGAAQAMARGQQVRLEHGAPSAAPSEPAPAATPAPTHDRTLVVELEDCIACGTCVEYCPAAFALASDGRARVVSQDVDAQELRDAMDACPTQCIRWEG
jgi:ferredoxin